MKDIEDFETCHDGIGVCPWSSFDEESNDFLLCFV